MLPENNNESFIINVINFDKHQIRRDVKVMSWIKLDAMLPMDDKMNQCDITTRWAFISILCLCARHRSSSIPCTVRLVSRWSQVRTNKVRFAINKLVQLQILSIEKRDVPVSYINKNKNKNNNINSSTHKKVRQTCVFNFEKVYELFPRKQGKKKGLQKCETNIKTDVKYTSLKTAVENYSKYVEENSIETQYMKLFSTFMSEWEDWIDPDTSSIVNGVKQRTHEQMKKFLDEE